MTTYLAAARLLGPMFSHLNNQILKAGQNRVNFANLLRDAHSHLQINFSPTSPSMAQNSRIIEEIQALLLKDMFIQPLAPINGAAEDGNED